MTAIPSLAAAQTWAGGVTTPTIGELVAIDKTGENPWPYGFEDVAGDGDTFQQQEQSVDIRTAYASTDANQFWVRAYVSDTANAGGNIQLFVFIDSDKNSATGSSAIATNVDTVLDSDPSMGGYEYIFGIQGNASVLGVWQWDGNAFTRVNTTPAQVQAEAGTDIDPIHINADGHGYIQGMVALSLVGLTQACDANLFVRSVNQARATSDLDVGAAGSCIPVDADADNIPDIVDRTECSTDNNCPGGGTCIDGQCTYTAQCNTNADCANGQVCSPNKLCVVAGGQACSSNADCSSNLCVNGQCEACTTDSQCGSGRACRADGVCVAGTGDDLEVQGGACACRAPARTADFSKLALLLGVGLGAGVWRRRRRVS
jgi:Cys-rich repeat protein